MQKVSARGTVAAAVVLLLCVSGCTAAESDLCREPRTSPVVEEPDAYPIAFTSDRSGSFDLWLIGADGSDPVQLTSAREAEGMASWSPDGRQLVFTAAADLESNGDICVINADGTGLRNLTGTTNRYETTPAWSPDGDQIAYGVWEEDSNKIYVMGTDGGNSRRLTSNGNWPSWSPDGEQIVYSTPRGSEAGQDLWTMNRDGSNQSLLARDTAEMTEPTWSPDGRTIAFVMSRTREDIYVLPAEGGPARRITQLPGHDHWPPAWSPDSRRLAFTADGVNGVGEIVVVDLETLATTNLTGNDAQDAFPAWRR